MLGLAHRGFAMTDYRRHIVHTLRDAGYRSVLAGLQHVAAKPEQIGYDEILHPATTQAADVAPQAVAFLDSKPAGPFFLDCGFFETHREYPKPTPDDDARYIQPPTPIPDTPATRADMAGVPRQRAQSGSRRRPGARCPGAQRAGGKYAGDQHHRSRPRIPPHEVQPHGFRMGRLADSARSRRILAAAKSATRWSRISTSSPHSANR